MKTVLEIEVLLAVAAQVLLEGHTGYVAELVVAVHCTYAYRPEQQRLRYHSQGAP